MLEKYSKNLRRLGNVTKSIVKSFARTTVEPYYTHFVKHELYDTEKQPIPYQFGPLTRQSLLYGVYLIGKTLLGMGFDSNDLIPAAFLIPTSVFELVPASLFGDWYVGRERTIQSLNDSTNFNLKV